MAGNSFETPGAPEKNPRLSSKHQPEKTQQLKANLQKGHSKNHHHFFFHFGVMCWVPQAIVSFIVKRRRCFQYTSPPRSRVQDCVALVGEMDLVRLVPASKNSCERRFDGFFSLWNVRWVFEAPKITRFFGWWNATYMFFLLQEVGTDCCDRR